MSWDAQPVVAWLLREGRLEADPLKLVGALGAHPVKGLAAPLEAWTLADEVRETPA